MQSDHFAGKNWRQKKRGYRGRDRTTDKWMWRFEQTPGDRGSGAWDASVHGVAKVGYNLAAIKLKQVILLGKLLC